jgi:hypothetical protein
LYLIISLAFIHDAVLTWAYAVNKTVEQGYAPDDGMRIIRNTFNLQFEGITGSMIFDENGNVRVNYR